jgi:hypothetical protein
MALNGDMYGLVNRAPGNSAKTKKLKQLKYSVLKLVL